MQIQEKFIGWGLNNNPNATFPDGVPKGIIVHQTGNLSPSATARAHSNMQQNDVLEVSWNATADDIEIIQDFADNRRTWHAGNSWANGNLMSLEICVNKTRDKEAYTKAVRNGAFFVATKMKKYGWNTSHIHKHKEYANTSCPEQLSAGLHGITWDKFLGMVKEELAKLNGTPVGPTTPTGPVPTFEKSLSKVAKQYLSQTGEKFIEWNTGTRTWDDWCAYFVSYCIYETYGVVRKFGFVDEVVEGMTQIPGPEKDCLVWYDRNNNKRGDHIGICSYAQGSNFTVIEGNTKNDDNSKSIVSENSYHTSDLPFRFYRIPDSMKKPAEPVKGRPMKVTLPEDTAVYRSVEDASTGKNPIMYKAGDYSIYKTYGEFVNITKTTMPGGWIKLRGIK